MKIEVVRNFMSDERNFKNIEGQWELQSIAENIIAWEELTSDYTEIFNAGLSMLQEKFRDDRQKFYDRQKFAEDKHQWKQSYKIFAGLLEHRQQLKSAQNKDWIRYAKLKDEQVYTLRTWNKKKRQIEEAISNGE